jgi:hypothetical protein
MRQLRPFSWGYPARESFLAFLVLGSFHESETQYAYRYTGLYVIDIEREKMRRKNEETARYAATLAWPERALLLLEQ